MNSSASKFETNKNVLLFVFILLLVLFGGCAHLLYLFNDFNQKRQLKLIKRESQAHKENRLYERAFNFEQYKNNNILQKL